MSIIKAVIFASGTGSNFQAIMEKEDLACEIVLLVCDKPGAAVIEKARKFRVPTLALDPRNFPSKSKYESRIVQELGEYQASWIFLAGYMRIVGRTLLQRYPGKIINIHPSFLPAYPGKDAIGQAFRAGAKETGVTVHYIDEGIDTGPIISQEKVDILPDDTVETLKVRIQKAEHALYPRVINRLIKVGTDHIGTRRKIR